MRLIGTVLCLLLSLGCTAPSEEGTPPIAIDWPTGKEVVRIGEVIKVQVTVAPDYHPERISLVVPELITLPLDYSGQMGETEGTSVPGAFLQAGDGWAKYEFIVNAKPGTVLTMKAYAVPPFSGEEVTSSQEIRLHVVRSN